MNYYVTVEADYTNKAWCVQCLDGISQEIARTHGNLIQFSLSDVNTLDAIAGGTDRALTIVIGSLQSWIRHTVGILQQYHIHCVVLTSCMSFTGLSISSVSIDYAAAVYTFCDYLLRCSREKIALVGVYRDSLNDLSKTNAFTHFMKDRLQEDADGNVFWVQDEIRPACEAFLEQVGRFNAVICANDEIALYLLVLLRERNISVPQQLYLIGLSGRSFSQYVHPGITSIHPDFQLMGKNAIRVYAFLSRSPEITSFHAQVNGRVVYRDSSARQPYTEQSSALFDDFSLKSDCFFNDPYMQPIFALEKLFSNCDALDLSILRCISEGKSYSRISQELYTTEYTVKYRLKRILSLTHIQTRRELLSQLVHYSCLNAETESETVR